MSEHGQHERRATDPLIKELISEVRGFREDMKPIREFMENVKAAQKAAVGVLAILAGIGAAITWFLNVKDHIHKGP